MQNIYKYIGDEFDNARVMDNIAQISNELDEEQSKPNEERDKDKEFKLIYRQFMEGLKLSTRYKRLW